MNLSESNEVCTWQASLFYRKASRNRKSNYLRFQLIWHDRSNSKRSTSNPHLAPKSLIGFTKSDEGSSPSCLRQQQKAQNKMFFGSGNATICYRIEAVVLCVGVGDMQALGLQVNVCGLQGVTSGAVITSLLLHYKANFCPFLPFFLQTSCWNVNPKERPSFSQLSTVLGKSLQSECPQDLVL